MKKYKVHIKGIRPLIHKKYPLDEQTLNTKSKKSTVFDVEKEIESCLYKDAEGKIYQPSAHIEACLIKGATQIKWQGKKTFKDLVAQGIFVDDDKLRFKVPENPEDFEVDITTAVIPATRGRMPIARPKWNEWEFEFTLTNHADEHISKDTLENILVEAGKIGIGTYRLKFGKFEPVSVEEIK